MALNIYASMQSILFIGTRFCPRTLFIGATPFRRFCGVLEALPEEIAAWDGERHGDGPARVYRAHGDARYGWRSPVRP